MSRLFHFRASFLHAALLGAAALPCLSPCIGAEVADGLRNSSEYIAGFVRYVHWRNEEHLAAWTVCVVGNLPPEQDSVYADRLVRGKRFAVRHIDEEAPLADCQVLDLTASDAATAARLLARARHQPILAVGSGSTFCSSGGQICLYLDSKQAEQQKFEVNISAMREATLGVSARLLTLGSSRTAARGSP